MNGLNICNLNFVLLEISIYISDTMTFAYTSLSRAVTCRISYNVKSISNMHEGGWKFEFNACKRSWITPIYFTSW